MKGFCFFYSSRSFFVLAFFSFCKSQKKWKTKTIFFPHNRVRSWLAYPESLCFQVFSLFLICCDRTRRTEKSIHSQEDKKKNFPLLFWFATIAQGAWKTGIILGANFSPVGYFSMFSPKKDSPFCNFLKPYFAQFWWGKTFSS